MSTSERPFLSGFGVVSGALLMRGAGPLAFACLSIVLLLGCPCNGQAQDLAELLSGKAPVLAMKLKEFSADWRRITIPGNAGVHGNISVNVTGNSSAATS